MIVGISGKRGSGKSTLANIFIERGFKEISFADPMKRFCKEVFDFTDEQLYGPSEARNKIDPRWGISPRYALQTLGTEWGRLMHPDIWVVAAIRAARLVPNAVISDCRFENELEAIHDAGGVTVRIRRDLKTSTDDRDIHKSETSLDHVPDTDFSFLVLNYGPVQLLRDTADAIVARST